ncbi:uncharacterized protein PGTG_00007 [Puccinia graminis f. sp. tritici CRL 75-36-700-3]|uniref:Uncharacterized protein n=1 Tax=Puccinia graminis f. sp. tritici (strain CRL 75-36-700-3 / race SCCL) TaxID=418459 RepID=E3JPW8_PUCGT|nr:uncharacterized protein PGTG_00007 [Puccinia graminis f. sp. tritici CRL 75-36-700-3]EFP74051.1 hypothetical protein PGTG_00007 [Puccinia graminis f. sp. tritici CRL 75-36-700-3]
MEEHRSGKVNRYEKESAWCYGLRIMLASVLSGEKSKENHPGPVLAAVEAVGISIKKTSVSSQFIITWVPGLFSSPGVTLGHKLPDGDLCDRNKPTSRCSRMYREESVLYITCDGAQSRLLVYLLFPS